MGGGGRPSIRRELQRGRRRGAGPASVRVQARSLDRARLRVRDAAASGDEYVCYGVDVTRPTPTHVTGFVPRVDNTKIVHHIVLFESSAAYPTTPQKCSSGGSLRWRMVMGWAPGAKGLEMPPEAGFPLATSGATHDVVQMHYSNPQALAGQKDTSGFDLCTGPPRQHEADVMAFGTQTFTIPPSSVYEKTCSVTVQKAFGVDFAGLTSSRRCRTCTSSASRCRRYSRPPAAALRSTSART